MRKPKATTSKTLVVAERIDQMIMLIRGEKVILSHDIAALYGVETRALVQAVVRNRERFPKDFMFQLTSVEAKSLRSQTVILENPGRGQHSKYLPYAFTEQGVAMLSSVLRSRRAVSVNIEIMRTFVRLRQMLSTHQKLRRKIEELEKKYDRQFSIVFDALRQMMTEPDEPTKPPIGFESEATR